MRAGKRRHHKSIARGKHRSSNADIAGLYPTKIVMGGVSILKATQGTPDVEIFTEATWLHLHMLLFCFVLFSQPNY